MNDEDRNAQWYIRGLGLEAHPEGGWYRQSAVSVKVLELGGADASRKLWSSIYFLLEAGDASHLHRLTADELWYFHAGSPLSIYMISPDGDLEIRRLGLNMAAGELPQQLVPAGWIFGSCMQEGAYSLVGCMVAPGFEFSDFELFERNDLLQKFPQHETVIRLLTRG